MEKIAYRGGWSLTSLGMPVIALTLSLVAAISVALLRKTGIVWDPLQSSFDWFRLRHLVETQWIDSWVPMQAAIDGYDSGKFPTLYGLLKTGQMKFQYPPTSLLIHAGAKAIGLHFGVLFLNWIGWACAGLTVIAVAFLWWPLDHLFHPTFDGRYSTQDKICLAIATVIFGMLFYPLLKAYTLGQIQTCLDLLFALSIIAWLYERRFLCGVLIGLICLVKPQLSLFVVWALLRRQRQFLVGWGICFGLGLISSLWRFGLENHLEYLNILSSLSKVGESYYPNQSMNGLLNRALFNGNNVEWSIGGFPPYLPLVHVGTLVSSAALVAFALFFRGQNPGGILDFAAAGLTFTIASPIAWEHHYGIVLPVAVVLLFSITKLRDVRSRNFLYSVWLICFLLCAFFLPITNRLAGTSFNFLQSTLFFGAMGMLGLLSWQRREF